jgi:hypothetical protein
MMGNQMKNSRQLLWLVAIIMALGTVGQCQQVPEGATAAQSPQQPSADQAPFSLLLTPVQNVVQAGGPVKLKVVTTNTSNHDLLMWVEYAADRIGWVYDADVRDENGNPPPLTKLGRIFAYDRKDSPNVGPGTFLNGNGRLYLFQPGEVATDFIDAATLYDFSQPGRYTIQVSRFSEGIPPSVAAAVKSNTVTVTVSPASGAQPASSTIAAASGSPPPFSLTIAASGGPVKSGSPVVLTIVTRNTSDHNILLWADSAAQEQAGSAYQVDILDAGGAVPADTEFGRNTKARTDVPRNAASMALVGRSGEKFVLKSGEFWKDTINISKLYQLYHSGEYTIQVERFDPATRAMVKSNTITVTVAPNP